LKESRAHLTLIELKGRTTQISSKKCEHKRMREKENEEEQRYAKKHKITPQDPKTPSPKQNTRIHYP
jgi:hypothetical protein